MADRRVDDQHYKEGKTSLAPKPEPKGYPSQTAHPVYNEQQPSWVDFREC